MRRLPGLVLFVLVALCASADRLQLANGDQLTGTIVEMNDTTVVITTEYGRMEVARDAIVRGEFGSAGLSDSATAVPGGAAADGTTAGGATGSGGSTGTPPSPGATGPDTQGTSPTLGTAAAAVAAAGTGLVDGLVFRFPLDGTLLDTTGTHVLANNGLQFSTDRSGKPRAALRSDGSGTYLSVAADDGVNALSAFTLAFLVRIESADRTRYLVSKWNRATGSSADGKFTLQIAGSNLTLFLVGPDGSYEWLAARNAMQQATWQAVAVTFSAGHGVIYVDGAEVASKNFTFTDLSIDANPILFMTAASDSDEQYAHYNVPGSIDDIRLYSRALGPAEVALLATPVVE